MLVALNDPNAESTESYHLPIVLYFSEDRLLLPQAPIPRLNHLRVVGYATVLVFD